MSIGLEQINQLNEDEFNQGNLVNKFLDFIINKDSILERVGTIDVCYSWGAGNMGFEPSIWNWHYYGDAHIKEHEQIKGFGLWLQFYCDYLGYFINIYYPLNARKGDCINVIFRGANINVSINWIHGKRGLFDRILILLFFEKIPLLNECDVKENIKYCCDFSEVKKGLIVELLTMLRKVQRIQFLKSENLK